MGGRYAVQLVMKRLLRLKVLMGCLMGSMFLSVKTVVLKRKLAGIGKGGDGRSY